MTGRYDGAPLPVAPGVAICLSCAWMDHGPARFARAARHRDRTGHPTLVSLIEPTTEQAQR